MNTPTRPPNTSLQDTISLVNAYLDNCRARGLAKESLRYYSDFLLKLAKQYPELPDIPEQLEEFICCFQSGDARRHGAFRAVRAFYNYLERRYSIHNPMKAVGAPIVRLKEKPSLTVEQLRTILEYPHGPLVRVLLHFLADTGCRIGEAAHLTSDDIFPDSVRLSGKTGERIVPISPLVGEMLKALGPGKVFKYTNHTLSDYVVKAGKRAGVPCNAHDFRRTMATTWRGSDLSLKYIGGWRSWKMVEHYSGKRLEKARDDHRLHSPIAMVYGSESTPAPEPVQRPLQSTGTIEYIIKMAEELGAARERIKQLEAIIEKGSLKVLARG